MLFRLLVCSPLLTQILIREVNIGVDGSLDLGMSQSLLDIAGIPTCQNQFCGMTVPELVRMNDNAAFATVVPEQRFDRFTIKWMSIGRVPPLVLRIRLEHHKQMIGLKAMLQEQVIKQGHQYRREINETLFPSRRLFASASFSRSFRRRIQIPL